MNTDLSQWNTFLEALDTKLQGPLPGHDAHRRMSPNPRPGWKPGHIPADARPGAALLLWFPKENTPCTVLTLRRKDLPDHPGQVSLPGGMVDPGETHEQAALREAHEEAGIDPQKVRIAAPLTPLYIPVSRFSLQTYVGLTDTQPDLRPAQDEVARILLTPLADLANSDNLGSTTRIILGEKRVVPHFDLDGERVWGATAMVLSEFLALLDLA